MSDTQKRPRVFISYVHFENNQEGEEKSVDNRPLALDLANRLIGKNIDCEIDQYNATTGPELGWQRWMLDQVEMADFVLVVCTPTYYKRFRAKEELGKGKGSIWEGAAIIQSLYDAAGKNRKFIPVGFAKHSEIEAFIPDPLRPYPYHNISTEEGFTNLLRHLTNQPAVIRPGYGETPILPPNP